MGRNAKVSRGSEFELSRLVSLGETTRGMVHEINNALSIIQGFTEQIALGAERGELAPERVLRSCQRILEATSRMVRTSRGLRSIAVEAGSENAELRSLAEFLPDVMALCEARFRVRGIRFDRPEVFEDAEFRSCSGDVAQALLQILLNAFEACREKPHAHVVFSAKVTGAEIRFRVLVADLPEKLSATCSAAHKRREEFAREVATRHKGRLLKTFGSRPVPSMIYELSISRALGSRKKSLKEAA